MCEIDSKENCQLIRNRHNWLLQLDEKDFFLIKVLAEN